jgi:amidase
LTAWRAQQTARLSALLGDDTVWVLPTTPTPPLSRQATDEERAQFYSVALALNAVAGLAGLPQLTLPLGELQGRPLGLSLIAGPGRDHALLDLAATMAPT